MNEFLNGLGTLNAEEKNHIMTMYARATIAPAPHYVQIFAKAAIEGVFGNHLDILNAFMSSVKDLNQLPFTKEHAEKGIHVLRSLFAREVLNARYRAQKPPADEKMRWAISRVRDYGYVDLGEFINKRHVDEVRAAIEKHGFSENKKPENLVANRNFVDAYVLQWLLWNSELHQYLMYCMGHDPYQPSGLMDQYEKNTFVQRIRNMPMDGDVQKVMHHDTYFDAYKFWYFPDATTTGLNSRLGDEGNFVYSPSSHLLSLQRLNWMQGAYMRHYNNTIEPTRTYGHSEGSLRILPHELKEIGHYEQPIKTFGNTLVIANVFGFHRRGDVQTETVRSAVHGSIRSLDPFSLNHS